MDLADTFKFTMDAEPEANRRSTLPPAGAQFKAPIAERELGQVRLVFTDYVMDVSGSRHDLRWSWEGPTTSPGSTQIRTSRVLTIAGSCEFVQPMNAVDWHHSVTRASADLEGDLTLSNARGTGSLNGTPLPPGIHLFQADGRMQVEATFDDPTSRWTVGGDPEFLALNAAPYYGSRDDLIAFAAITGTAALLAALAKWGRILGTLIPGLNLAKPLGNPQRIRLFSIIAEAPGLDQLQLARQAGLGRGTVRHHLRILLRADLVTERRLLSKNTYTLNDSSYDFPIDRAGSTTAGIALGILGNPTRAAIAKILAKSSDIDTPTLRQRLAEQGIVVPRDLASYHLRLLANAGLVMRRNEGKRTLWSIAMDPADMRHRQRDRFLKLGRLEQLLHAIPSTPTSIDDIHKALFSSNPIKKREIASKLELLAATGFVARTGDLYARAP